MPTKFFITHSWKDIKFARRLCDDLGKHGLDGFLDAHSIKPGESIPARIERGLKECDVYIPVFSPAALKSHWCEWEIDMAITLYNTKSRPRIIPVIAKPCGVPDGLNHLRHVNFVDRYDAALKELLSEGFGSSESIPQRDSVKRPQANNVRKLVIQISITIGTLVMLWLGLNLGVQIYCFFNPSLGPNVYRYSGFEVDESTTKCWRVRPDENGKLLGVKVIPDEQFAGYGRRSLRFDVNLAKVPNLALGQTQVAQIDPQVSSPDCPGQWKIPNQGRMSAWTYLPSNASTAGLVLEAEFFLQFSPAEWDASRPRVPIMPNKAVTLQWDGSSETWRNWETKASEGQINTAYGIEIRIAENSALDRYEGPVFIDEVVITTDKKPWRSPDYCLRKE